jgi:hypothetical protein
MGRQLARDGDRTVEATISGRHEQSLLMTAYLRLRGLRGSRSGAASG